MAISMYQASVPVLQKMLGNLDGLFDKALADAAARKYAPAVLLQARLAPDMFTFTRQVQIATDHAKGAPSRLAGVEVPKYEDTETTFEELRARVQKTRDYLATFTPAQIDGSDARTIVIKAGGHELTYIGQDYLLQFVLPNFFFHYSMAYAILRHNGVPVGKIDYLAGRGS